jgi:hypothetical protein
MIDIKIKTYPKIDEMPYLDVNKEYVRLDFICIAEEGINIKAKKEDGEDVHLCELDRIQAVQMATAVLSFFNAIHIK